MPHAQSSQQRRYERYLDKILPRSLPWDYRDKEATVQSHVDYMLCRTQKIFEWEGLPDTIPQRSLELYLQLGGHCAFAKASGSLYALTGGLGGEPDAYYMPTLYTVANPALSLSKSFVIGKECVVATNDSLYMGLMPLCSRHATLLAEAELSELIAIINSRIYTLISAADDATRESAEAFLEAVEAGDLGVIGESAFLDGVKAQEYGGTGKTQTLQGLLEYHQYLWASWLNDLGIQSNYNMKRERLSEAESGLNTSALLPLIDDMLSCRKRACEECNRLFGTSLSVRLSSAWEDVHREADQVGEPTNIEETHDDHDEEDAADAQDKEDPE